MAGLERLACCPCKTRSGCTCGSHRNTCRAHCFLEVLASEPTAMNGHWVPGPGAALFYAIGKALGPLKIIAEDLGVITPDVTALRQQFAFPGMRVLQFAFGSDNENTYLPHNYASDT